jgi:polysaccharide export outer membrane protein
MRVTRLLLISLAVALATSGCMQKRASRPVAIAAPAIAAPAVAAAAVAAPAVVAQQPAPMPPPIVMGPPAPSGPPDAAMAAEPAYMLDSGDKLRVVVFGQDGLSNSYAVDAAGNITMPLIGAVYAREHTTAALSQNIATKLRNGYIREPHVAVEVEAYRPFFILGEVTAPGQYPYVANMTAETAVAIAGGFSPRASKARVEVSRTVDGQLYRGKVPLTFPLRPGDTILISERWF